jgi:hypothetical protein
VSARLELVPEGQHDWKPHERSMVFGHLAMMVATIPTWIVMEITMDELDVAPKEGGKLPPRMNTSAEYLAALDSAVEQAQAALAGTTDATCAHRGVCSPVEKSSSRTSRSEMIQDTFSHLSHHRGQMTVYPPPHGGEGAGAVRTVCRRSTLLTSSLARRVC